MRHLHTIIAIAISSLALAACQRDQSATSTATTPVAASPTPLDRAAFEQDVAKWRSERVERLRKSDGWLTLVGLHWVEPGVHQLGMADSNDIQLRLTLEAPIPSPGP